MEIKNKIGYLIGLALSLVIIYVCFTGLAAIPASAAPLKLDPTPTPIVTYWTGEPRQFTWTYPADDCLSAGDWIEEIDDFGDCPELVAPADNYPAGIILTLDAKTFDGDSRLASGSNTDLAKKFTDKWGDPYMSVDETICIGLAGACSFVSMSPDANSDWEGYQTENGINYLINMYINQSLGSTGSLTFTIEPIWYGAWDCEVVEPDERIFIATGILNGDDEIGRTISLTEGAEYVLYTGGGPWNDSIDDRYDAAFRFYDGAAWGSWTELDIEESDLDICDDSFVDANGAVMAWTAGEDQEQIQLRVNDTDGNFGDNTGYIEYYLLDGEGFAQSCVSNWTKSDLISSATLNATKSFPQALLYGKISEGLYSLTVTGSFDDNGTPSSDVLIANRFETTDPNYYEYTDGNLWTGAEYCEVEYSDRTEYYGASRNTFYGYDYTYGWGESLPYGYVDDSNYADNSGTIQVDIHTVDYTAPASDCSQNYTRGTLLDSVVIDAQSSLGKKIPIQTNGLVPGQVYYIEYPVTGAPYSLNGSDSFDFEIGYMEYSEYHEYSGYLVNDWYDPETFTDCTVPLDESRYGYYFEADEEFIGIRAEYSLFGHSENDGSVKINLYGAIPNAVPDGESCSDWFDLDTLIWKDSVSAAESAGNAIDYSVFEPGLEYLIKIIGPAYYDPDTDGKTADIRRVPPGSGTVSYEAMEDWGGALCHEQINGYDYVYFNASEYTDYEVRATDADDGNNSGTMYYEVYGTDRTQETILGCELQNYGDVEYWFVVKEQGIIDANNDGSLNPEIMANELSDDEVRYKIEITGINGEDTGVYEVEISTDGGNTWVFLSDWVDCWVELEGVNRRGYFTTPKTGGPFLLRVYDSGSYQDNTGGLEYKMWVDSIEADPGDLGTFYETVTGAYWSAGCTAACLRPSWLNVGEMIEYARCRLTKWLAWCPWHNTAIAQLNDEFKEISAIAILYDLMGLGMEIRNELGLYDWEGDSGEGGGPDAVMEIQQPRNYLFGLEEGGGADIPGIGADSIWGGADIDLAAIFNSGGSYSTECETMLADAVGDNLGGPLCFGFNVIDRLGLLTWVQWLWDIAMVYFFYMYVKRAWIDPNTSG